MAIKARVYNEIRKDLYKKEIEETVTTKHYKIPVFTTEEKVELFDKWFGMNKEAHQELHWYKRKRVHAENLRKEREERGYFLKKEEKKKRREAFRKNA